MEVGWVGEWWLSSKSVEKSLQEIFNSIFALPQKNQFFATLAITEHAQIEAIKIRGTESRSLIESRR